MSFCVLHAYTMILFESWMVKDELSYLSSRNMIIDATTQIYVQFNS